MKFLVMIYTDPSLMNGLSPGEFDSVMRGCLQHADELQSRGTLLESQQLAPPTTATSFRTRNGRTTVLDGPFAETKEFLAGFNLIEARDMDEALRIAQEFPWARFGAVEVRPVKDMGEVRRQVGL
ncbi:MAG TPA: YciI family protein [Myxococcus sp.]|nr:YciI family protein [Myxococcus sp.]